ncbi:MAG: ExsB family transcriptional regulator [Desulfobacteraceae bacterium]|nr:ExsB family transcriptional regulator [Desulfobacteraceae bacterium]
MEIEEVRLENLDVEGFIREQVEDISSTVGNGLAINALSGGVDSSTVTMLAHKALGDRLKTYFIDSGLMREDEPEHIAGLFRDLGVHVELIDAKDRFLDALKGVSDPEEKRGAITHSFYAIVFAELAKKSGAGYVLQGTNFTDVEETVAGIKRQHNIIEQLGIDPETEYGYKIIEPLIQLRKPAIRALGKQLALPQELYSRPPFPGPALAARIIGEVTGERIETVRKATKVVEEELCDTGAFQYLAILHQDRVTGIRNEKRDYGLQIEVRCWDSEDAITGSPTNLPYETLSGLAERITGEVPGVVSVTYSISKKPPSTIEAL